MAFYDKFPYTNFHELNTDWIIQKIKSVEDSEAHTEELAEAAQASADASAASASASDQSAQASAASAEASAGSAADAETSAEGIEAARLQIYTNTARLDNLIVDGTPTEGNTELLDIRVGGNGVTYPTAGDAVRGQYSELNHALNNIISTAEAETSFETTSGSWDVFEYAFFKGITYKMRATAQFSFRTRTRTSETNIDVGSALPPNTDYVFVASGNAEILRLSAADGTSVTVSQINTIIEDINTLKEGVNELSDIAANVTEDYDNYSANLYNSATATSGYRLSASGQPVEATNPLCYVSDYIAIENGVEYQRSYFGDSYHRMSFYDSEKTHKYSTTDESYTNTLNYAFMRICGYDTEKESEAIYGLTKEKTAIDYKARKAIGIKDNAVDLIIFAGQSNMAGRGITSETWTEEAPPILPGAGYEFKAISDPTKLYPMTEPFGYAEDNPNGINDLGRKTGSMAVAFTNAYYLHNGNIPVVGVSASQGDTYTTDWIIDPEGSSLLTDLIARFNTAVTWLTTNGYNIRHKYCLWCQGEADGGGGQSTHEAYKNRAIQIFDTILNAGIEKVFMIRIGQKNDTDYTKYDTVIADQTDITKTKQNVIMASTDFVSMRTRGLMKDTFHYYQAGYNEVGTYAGINTAYYVNTGKEPTMYDPFTDDLYYSEKN